MDFVRYYDAYWQEKGDRVDRQRLALLADWVAAGERVLQVDGGPGWLAEMMLTRGAHVIMTDLSNVAVARAQARGVDARQCDIDASPLPFEDSTFDVVVSDSQLEHRFDPEHALDELTRVLRPGGRLILLLPNTAHWRVRLWLLAGRFPYVPNTPTDWLHLRFFTLHDTQTLLASRGLTVEATDGSASLWVKELYPAFVRSRFIARLYTRLARRWPGMFARDFIVVARKSPSAQLAMPDAAPRRVKTVHHQDTKTLRAQGIGEALCPSCLEAFVVDGRFSEPIAPGGRSTTALEESWSMVHRPSSFSGQEDVAP